MLLAVASDPHTGAERTEVNKIKTSACRDPAKFRVTVSCLIWAHPSKGPQCLSPREWQSLPKATFSMYGKCPP